MRKEAAPITRRSAATVSRYWSGGGRAWHGSTPRVGRLPQRSCLWRERSRQLPDSVPPRLDRTWGGRTLCRILLPAFRITAGELPCHNSRGQHLDHGIEPEPDQRRRRGDRPGRDGHDGSTLFAALPERDGSPAPHGRGSTRTHRALLGAEAAVDVERCTRHEAGFGAGQVRHHSGYVINVAVAAHSDM